MGADHVQVGPLVAAFRAHDPGSVGRTPASPLLARLCAAVRVGLVSDGDVHIQRGKLRAIGLQGAFDVVVWSDELGRTNANPVRRPFSEPLTCSEESRQKPSYCLSHDICNGSGTATMGRSHRSGPCRRRGRAPVSFDRRDVRRQSEGISVTGLSVGAIICAYTLDRWALLERAIDSVVSQSVPPDEVILVIDHNETLFERSQRRWPECRVVPNAGNRGLSDARNTGVELASSDVVAFLDDDAAAEPTWIERLSRHMSDPKVTGVGSRVEPLWETERPAWFPEEFDWVVGCSYRGMPEGVEPVRNPIGASMLFRRRAILEHGGFSSVVGRVGSLPRGCEETELSIRIRRSGGTILYDPSTVVAHVVSAERACLSYFLRRCRSEGHSKAAIERLVGREAALESERTYVVHALLSGLRLSLVRAVFGPNRRDALARGAVIGLGFVVTAAGYAEGRARSSVLRATSRVRRRKRSRERPLDISGLDTPEDDGS